MQRNEVRPVGDHRAARAALVRGGAMPAMHGQVRNRQRLPGRQRSRYRQGLPGRQRSRYRMVNSRPIAHCAIQ